MRHAALVVGLVGCAGTATVPRDEVIISRSHAVLEAIDRGDTQALDAVLAPDYVHFESRVIDREHELKAVARVKEDPSGGVAERTWKDEHVFARGTEAVFVGRSMERQKGNDVHGGGYRYDGWYTMVWTKVGVDWRLAFQEWRPATDGARTEWNQIFDQSTGFEHEPNKLLVEWAAKAPGGTAVDVAMGQGRNAVWLAKQGWKVTGVDISDVAIHQASAAADSAHVALDAVTADVTKYDYGVERFDLVAMIYAYPAIPKIPQLMTATKPGGLFVYEFFAPDGSGDDVAPAAGALAKQFAGWDILVDQIVDDVPDWRAARAHIQRFVARKPAAPK